MVSTASVDRFHYNFTTAHVYVSTATLDKVSTARCMLPLLHLFVPTATFKKKIHTAWYKIFLLVVIDHGSVEVFLYHGY